jgi:hypothetical protein
LSSVTVRPVDAETEAATSAVVRSPSISRNVAYSSGVNWIV